MSEPLPEVQRSREIRNKTKRSLNWRSGPRHQQEGIPETILAEAIAQVECKSEDGRLE